MAALGRSYAPASAPLPLQPLHPQRQQQLTPPVFATTFRYVAIRFLVVVFICFIKSALVLRSLSQRYLNDQPIVEQAKEKSVSSNQEVQNHRQESYRIVVVVPGHGDPQRFPQLHATLQALSDSCNNADNNNYPSVEFTCLVYVWKEELMNVTASMLSDLCKVEFNVGLWTHHMEQVGRSKASRALLFPDSNTSVTTTHVALLMDDVDASTVNLPRMLDTMRRAHLTVAAPSVVDVYAASFPRQYCLAHETGHIDMLFTIFSLQVWQCWQRQLNTDSNPLGWGYDLLLSRNCRRDNATIGVVDHERMYHAPACAGSDMNCGDRSYSGQEAKKQMYAWMQEQYPNDLNSTDAVKSYYHKVVNERPLQYPYCNLVGLYQPYPYSSGSSSLLRHGLNATQHSFDMKSIDDQTQKPLKSPNQSMAVSWDGDSTLVEKWFLETISSTSYDSSDTIVTRSNKWIGLVHHVPELMRNVSGSASTDRYTPFPLYSQEYLDQCVALVVFTAATKKAVEQELGAVAEVAALAASKPRSSTRGNGISKVGPKELVPNTIVCVVRHPIAASSSDDGAGAGATSSMRRVGFDPDLDLTAILAAHSHKDANDELLSGALVLYNGGLISNSRVSSLNELETNRVKRVMKSPTLGLPNEADTQSGTAEEQADRNGRDPDESHTIAERASYLRQNLILVDSWDDTAYEPALDALVLQSPLIMRRLDGFVEYLGVDYPLFYTSLQEVQSLLDDEQELHAKLLETHLYLRRRYAELSAVYTYEHLAQQVVNCTLYAMSKWKPPHNKKRSMPP